MRHLFAIPPSAPLQCTALYMTGLTLSSSCLYLHLVFAIGCCFRRILSGVDEFEKKIMDGGLFVEPISENLVLLLQFIYIIRLSLLVLGYLAYLKTQPTCPTAMYYLMYSIFHRIDAAS